MAEPYDDRTRAGPAELDAFLQDLGASLEREIHAWAIGGGPMVQRGLKDGTKDLDLVLDDEDDRRHIQDRLKDRGYRTLEGPPAEYEGLQALLMHKDGHVGVDLFIGTIMGKLQLSDTMKDRADPPRRHENLVVHRCANEDIFILKAVTKRPDDDADLLDLLATGLDAETIRDELASHPPRRGGLSWNAYLHQALTDAEDRLGREIVIKDEIVG